MLSQDGAATSIYGFTGEQLDASTGLEYLRARFYDPVQGRFVSADPSDAEANLYLYASANPVLRTDAAGLMSGPEAFAKCFNIHTISQLGGGLNAGTLSGTTAQDAVDICKLAYSKDAWSLMPFGDSPTTAHNLFGVYLNETSAYDRLFFHANDPLTKELSESMMVMTMRRSYLQDGETIGPQESRFNLKEQLECPFEYFPASLERAFSLPLCQVLGSVYYQLKMVNTDKGSYVGFRVDNRTDLESGSHIAFRFPGDVSGSSVFGGSVEELIANREIRGNEAILDVMNQSYGGKKVVSILKARTRDQTGQYKSSLGTHELGGGNLIQTFVWMEKYDPCDPLSRLGFYAWRWHDLIEWEDWYPPVTQPIQIWGEGI